MSSSHTTRALLMMAATLIALTAFSLICGRYHVPLSSWLQLARGAGGGDEAAMVLLQIRLPRVGAGLLIGGGLALAGAAYQGLFRNPMVSPEILGASTGAGFGAALTLLLGGSILWVEMASFAGGMCAVGLCCLLAANSRRRDPILTLVLTGILVSTLFGSLITLIKFVADPCSRLAEITFWLMGSLSAINTHDLSFAAAPIVVGSTILMLLRWRLNVLCLGEDEARTLGMETQRLRWTVIVAATLVTSAAISISGVIGWIGLVSPHIGRMIVGPNHKVLLPASLMLGGAFLLAADDLARLSYATELPLGVLTSLVGAPFFLYLLLRSERRAS